MCVKYICVFILIYTFTCLCILICMCMHAKSLQLFLILCNPMDYSLPGSSVHGILQARILEWVAMPSSRGSSWPRDRTCIYYISCIDRCVLYHWHHLRFGIDNFRIQSSPEMQPLESPQLCSFVPNTFSIFINIFKQVSKFKNIYWEHPCYLLSVSTIGILSYSLSQTCSFIHPSIKVTFQYTFL